MSRERGTRLDHASYSGAGGIVVHLVSRRMQGDDRGAAGEVIADQDVEVALHEDVTAVLRRRVAATRAGAADVRPLEGDGFTVAGSECAPHDMPGNVRTCPDRSGIEKRGSWSRL